MKWRFFVAEALNSIRGNAATTLAATVTVLIVTFLLGVSLTVGKWVYDYTVGVRSQVTVKAYISNTVGNDPTARSEVANEIKAIPYVKGYTYITPAEAKARLDPSLRAAIDALQYNPLPPEFAITLTDPNKASQVEAAAKKIPQVAACGSTPCVEYNAQITGRVLRYTWIILIFVVSLVVLLGAAAVVLITNTIRLSIFSRRREIEVMKLVGATNAFVRLPFMLEGMITGFVGSLAALGLLAVVYFALESIRYGLTDPVRSVGVVPLVAILASFGLVLGAISSMFTLRRFLKV